MEEESRSIFVEYFGDSPYIRVLDFLIAGQMFDYSMTEVSRGANVGWGSFTKIWTYLLKKNLIAQTRTIGNAKLFRLNKENPIVQKLIKIDWELTKLATDEMLKEQKVNV